MRSLIFLVLLFSFSAQAHEGGGLVFYAKLHQAVIEQCISKARWVEHSSEPENYLDYLDVSDVEVEFHYQGHTGYYSCQKNFYDIIAVHFYKDVEGLNQRIMKLRDEI